MLEREHPGVARTQGDLPQIGSQGCSHSVLPWPCLHMLDEADVAVHLDTSSHFIPAVPYAGRLKVGLGGEDVALEGSSRKQIASQETTLPWDAIHLQQRHAWETCNVILLIWSQFLQLLRGRAFYYE